MKQYELRRESQKHDITIFRGTEKECIDYMNESIERNNYKEYDLLTDINMKPVWSMSHAAYYLKKASK